MPEVVLELETQRKLRDASASADQGRRHRAEAAGGVIAPRRTRVGERRRVRGIVEIAAELQAGRSEEELLDGFGGA